MVVVGLIIPIHQCLVPGQLVTTGRHTLGCAAVLQVSIWSALPLTTTTDTEILGSAGLALGGVQCQCFNIGGRAWLVPEAGPSGALSHVTLLAWAQRRKAR